MSLFLSSLFKGRDIPSDKFSSKRVSSNEILFKEGKFWIQELIVQEVVTNWCQKHNQQETNL